MKIFVTFEKTVKEIELEEAKQTVSDLRKKACELFGVPEDEVVLRSGTRPIKDSYTLQAETNINMGRKKEKQPEPSESDEYEYVYEEVTDDDEDYQENAGSDDESDDSDGYASPEGSK